MSFELPGCQVQRPVLAIEQIGVTVENGMRHGIYGLRVLDHGSAVLPHLKLLHPLDVAVSGILVLDLKSEGVQAISQTLGKFRYSQGILIRLPDLPVKDIPNAALPVETGDGLEIICKGIADSNLIPLARSSKSVSADSVSRIGV